MQIELTVPSESHEQPRHALRNSRVADATGAGRAQEAGRLAHTIKSAGRTFGVDSLIQQTEQIEELAAAGELEAARRVTAELSETISRFLREIQGRGQQNS